MQARDDGLTLDGHPRRLGYDIPVGVLNGIGSIECRIGTSGLDFWHLTESGRTSLEYYSVGAGAVRSLLQILDRPHEEKSKWELILSMQQEGWGSQCL